MPQLRGHSKQKAAVHRLKSATILLIVFIWYAFNIYLSSFLTFFFSHILFYNETTVGTAFAHGLFFGIIAIKASDIGYITKSGNK